MTQDEKFIFKKIIKEGTIIKSSGTSGIAKDIFQSPVKLKAADKIAIECQGITPNSKIYTVCNLNHAGGLLAQTLPGFRIGADVTVEKFNAYKFCRVIQNYTHTHITPAHGEAIIQTKSFKNLNLSNLTITCGSDRVKWNLIEKFVERGATFICNWGMSEIGPIVINTVFNSINKFNEFKNKNLKIPSTTILGDRIYCDYQIIKSKELIVKGDNCVYRGWFHTGDLVEELDGVIYYHGRK